MRPPESISPDDQLTHDLLNTIGTLANSLAAVEMVAGYEPEVARALALAGRQVEALKVLAARVRDALNAGGR